MKILQACAVLLLALLSSGCGTLQYDLSSVPVPVSAKPAAPGVAFDPLELDAKSVLWVHGLFGDSQPDVAKMVADAAQGYDRIAGFRVRQAGGFHDWLLTHLSLTLVRMKTVTIEGQLVRDGG